MAVMTDLSAHELTEVEGGLAPALAAGVTAAGVAFAGITMLAATALVVGTATKVIKDLSESSDGSNDTASGAGSGE